MSAFIIIIVEYLCTEYVEVWVTAYKYLLNLFLNYIKQLKEGKWWESKNKRLERCTQKLQGCSLCSMSSTYVTKDDEFIREMMHVQRIIV
jgi:hypothetical protein